jgi:hypothetical protein
VHRLTGEVSSFAPAASPRVRRRPSPWPPHRHSEPASESTTSWWSCTADRPTSTRLEPAARLRSFTRWFKLRLHLPVSLAGPGLSGGANPSRRCRGCSHPHLRPQARAAPSFQWPAATGQRWSPFTSTRYMAPRGAPERQHITTIAAPPSRDADRHLGTSSNRCGARYLALPSGSQCAGSAVEASCYRHRYAAAVIDGWAA